MPWWMWTILGIVIVILELFTPSSFFLVFIGLSGIITGILTGMGLLEPDWLQWLVCGVTLIFLVAFFRKPLMGTLKHGSGSQDSPMQGDEVLVLEAIQPGQIGKGELRGSQWSVKNSGSSALEANRRYAVQKVDRLTLHVSHQ